MPHRIRIEELWQALGNRIQLHLHAGEEGLNKTLLDDALDEANDLVAGPLNFIHPNRVQVIGQTESDYLAERPHNRAQALNNLFHSYTRAVILVDGVQPDPDMLEAATASQTPLFSSPLKAPSVLDHLQHFAAIHLAETITLHGVFLEVLGMGVLITGDPAVGKSELALELITRGSRLIADDAPEFSRIAPDIINGQCPPLLREFLEVRGLGVLNIRAMFGDSAIKHNKYLKLIVHLKRMTPQQLSSMERLSPQRATREVLGVMVPVVTIPVAPGRNLGILVETAVRNHLLRLKGYDATAQFIANQQLVMDSQQ